MDRNSVIGLLLIAAVVVVFSVMNRPSPEEREAMQRQRDSVEQAEAEKQTRAPVPAQPVQAEAPPVPDSLAGGDSARVAALVSRLGAFAPAADGEDSVYYIENDLLRVGIGARGGSVRSVRLKAYKTFDGMPLMLTDRDSSVFGLNFFSQNRSITTDELFFDVVTAEKDKLVMRLHTGPDRYIEYNYSLGTGAYTMPFTVTFRNMESLVASNTNYLELVWQKRLLKTEKDLENERNNASVYYQFMDEEVENLSETSDEQEDLMTKVRWVAFKQHFFTSALVAEQGFEKPTRVESVTDEEASYIKECRARFTIPFSHGSDESFPMSFYYGPNHFQTLKKTGLGMEELINLGIFGFVSKGLVIPVFNWLNSFDLNFGIIILILTVLIRIILLPLTFKSFMATAKMRVLQPEVGELNKKHAEDPMKKQQELMALYRKAGVNPLGGCIPALLQIPILFAMFRFFPTSIELRQESFLWADDLSTYDSIASLPFHIPFYGSHVSLFTLLMTLSTLLYTAINMQMTSAVNPQMKWMMYLMPVMFLGFFNSFAAGLSYYYLLSNLFGLGQQFMFKAFVNEDAIHRKIQENKKKPVKKSAFQQRLEKMARERGYKPPR